MTKITAYTDGSAVVNGARKGNGGFGTYFPNLFSKPCAFSCGFKETKTGRMEITALLYAIKAMPLKYKEKVELTVYSDSEYVVKTFTENRIERWVSNNWRNSGGLVKNRDLWERILNELEKRGFLNLIMIHIRSHQVEKASTKEEKEKLMKNPHIRGNMVADRLADYKRHKTLK